MEIMFSGFSGQLREDLLFQHQTTNYSLNGAFHRHEGYELYLFLRGNVNCYVEQLCFHMEPGDLLVIRPGQYHRPVMLDQSNYERITLNFRETLLQKLSTEQTDLSSSFCGSSKDSVCLIRLSGDQLQHYLSLTSKIEPLLESDEFGADLLIQSYLTQLFVFINRVLRTAGKPTSNIMPKLIRVRPS